MFERVPDVELPTGVSAGVSPLFSPSGLVYRYVLQSPDRSARDLHILQDWVIERAYKSVPGVADLRVVRRRDDAVPGAHRSEQARRGWPHA